MFLPYPSSGNSIKLIYQFAKSLGSFYFFSDKEQDQQSDHVGEHLYDLGGDLQIRKVFLGECVKTSIHNNRFFLIQGGFRVQADTGELAVYTDPQWLVYILDQLIGNAVKYGKKAPREEEALPALKIWAEEQDHTVTLWVEDRGQGIQKQDMERIFEKGYTGSNYHNGKYKSTGMGLYMAKTIMERMGHGIKAESIYGEYSRFSVIFRENSYFLNG